MTFITVIDLDGTIRETISGAKFINNNPYDQRIIPQAQRIMRAEFEAGMVFYGCTNQGGVESGFKSLENMIKEQLNTLEICPYLRAIAAAPYNKKGGLVYWFENKDFYAINVPEWSSPQKPDTGMIEVIRSHMTNHYPGSANLCRMIGDMESDQTCADKANINFQWADKWKTSYANLNQSQPSRKLKTCRASD